MKKEFIQKLGFLTKENSNNIFIKQYENNSILEVDFEKEFFNYGNKIQIESKTTSNFSQAENWVVFECVNRLLEKGYLPEDIILEKTYKLGHINKGRLDILVKKEGKTFLMIECKTWGLEFEKEFKNMKKDGGQLFSYFQQDRDAKYLVLYASNENLEYKSEIVKVEEHYKETTSVVDFYDRWNKLTKQNGIFENWIKSYNFKSRALTKKDLKPIRQEDASIIFNSFLEILRKNTVSDKPNAFNKIFTLFLCKIYDEGDKGDNDELEFQWVEGEDNNVKFQLKLNDLYKKGMEVLLEKEVSDLTNTEFNEKFGTLDENMRKSLLEELNRIRLEKNNEFSIKDVFDHETFLENAVVLKEVVELLQKYQIRYDEKQPFLGDFFELLLTTGLKQEAGQFFTPVPVAKFICKSIPIKNIIEEKITNGNIKDLLPTTIDYAAGSGHFLTESMEEIQTILKDIPKDNLKPVVSKKIKAWEGNFDWAYDYMYGIEKDYRLVKTAKVGCFLHGDGIANVIHGDGLDSFEKSKKYRGKLKIEGYNSKENKDNGNFDLVLSNPPYSVGSFKSNLKEYAKDDFNLFSKLTEQSSEIEALFIERTSQLLKEGGIAGIILPSSILSNTGIYTKAREIILKDFEIIAITELGSNTFMATGTNTVTLFLRKRNKYFSQNLESSVNNFFTNFLDVVFKGTQIEKPVSKYISDVWEGINFEDYISLLQKSPNESIKNHEIFKDYENKIKLIKKGGDNRQKELFEKIIEIEKEKLFYFVLSFSQKVVLVKAGEKKIEKEFLGYEFSNRKGSEGIHPIQRGKQIDECTKLFDQNISDNPEKASTYIYDAFGNKYDREITEEMKNHIFRTKLSDLLTFDRTDFEKTISLNLKKKVKIESKYGFEKLGDLIIENGKSKIQVGTAKDTKNGEYNFFTSGEKIFNFNNYLVEGKNLYLSTGGNAIIKKYNGKASYSTDTYSIKGNEKVLTYYLYNILNNIIGDINDIYFKGQGLKHLQKTEFKNIKIPLPPKDIQQKIVNEIGELEKIEEKNINNLNKLENNIKDLILNSGGEDKKFNEVLELISGQSPKSEFYNNIGKGLAFYQGKKDYGDDYLKKPTTWTNKVTKISFKNDVLMSVRAPVGDVNLNNFDEICIGRGLSALRPFDILNYKFLYFYLKFNQDIIVGKQGVGFESVSRDDVLNLKISLPPLETQKQIVSKIEILEKEIEELKSENKNIPEKKKEILNKYL